MLVPIVLLAVYGVVSYKKAEDAIIGNHEASSHNTIDAISRFMNFGLNMIDKTAMEITNDINFKNYFNLNYDAAMDNIKPMMISMTGCPQRRCKQFYI